MDSLDELPQVMEEIDFLRARVKDARVRELQMQATMVRDALATAQRESIEFNKALQEKYCFGDDAQIDPVTFRIGR